jgi:hypothetical protein
MFINIYVCYVGLKEIYMSNTYSPKKTNFSAKIKYSFSTYRTSYFYLKSCLIFFLSWTKYNKKSKFVRT